MNDEQRSGLEPWVSGLFSLQITTSTKILTELWGKEEKGFGKLSILIFKSVVTQKMEIETNIKQEVTGMGWKLKKGE